MRHLVLVLSFSVFASTPLRAQFQVGAGIGPHPPGAERELGAPAVWANQPSLSNAATRQGRWKWIAVGAVLGGVLGGALAARQVARTDDAFFAGPFVGLGVVAGVVGGGLIGALAHATLHPAPSTMSPNDR